MVKNHMNRYLLDGDFVRAEKYIKRLLGEEAADEMELFWEVLVPLIETAAEIWPSEDLAMAVFEVFDRDLEINSWLRRFFQYLKKLPRSKQGDALDHVLAWMEKSFAEGITLNEAAEKMGMDPAYFSRFFKKNTGKNFSDMLIDIRMRHCEKMLKENPELTLDVLAHSCGYYSKTYFSEVFKKWKGITITQYLKGEK